MEGDGAALTGDFGVFVADIGGFGGCGCGCGLGCRCGGGLVSVLHRENTTKAGYVSMRAHLRRMICEIW